MDKNSKPYPARHAASEASTHETDALVVMSGLLRREPIVAAAFEFGFMGGSMGSVVGERFALGVEEAIRRRAPFVVFCASGGARMQEGLFSLMQMAKTTNAARRLADYGLPFITVLTDPTMGGVSASFAGPRVIEQTVREKLPEGFQRSEFLLKHGQVDKIVDRRDMRAQISVITQLLMKKQPINGI